MRAFTLQYGFTTVRLEGTNSVPVMVMGLPKVISSKERSLHALHASRSGQGIIPEQFRRKKGNRKIAAICKLLKNLMAVFSIILDYGHLQKLDFFILLIMKNLIFRCVDKKVYQMIGRLSGQNMIHQ